MPKSHTVYFTMINNPVSGWMRVGKAYALPATAEFWLAIEQARNHGWPGKVEAFTFTMDAGVMDPKDQRILSEKFNMDPPEAPHVR